MANTLTELLDQCIPESAKKKERDEAWRRFKKLGKVADAVLGEMAELDAKYDFYNRG